MLSLIRKNEINKIKEYKKSFHVVDVMGNSLLHLAAENGNLEIVKIILNKMGNPDPSKIKNYFETTPLHYAAKNKSSDILFFLAQFSSDANVKNYNGRTPLDYAKTYNSEENIKFLEKYSNTSIL